jgi:carbamoyl-phosphate synthase small subunit
LTDPSYHRQMITMTAPEIGNVGVNPDDAESRKVWAAGLIVKNLSLIPSNYRSRQSLHQYLEAEGIPGISGLDTRALTRHLRDHGSQMAALSTNGGDPAVLIEEARAADSIEADDLVAEVTCREPYVWEATSLSLDNTVQIPPKQKKIVVLDFGVKYQTLRLLRDHGCEVIVAPAQTSAQQIIAFAPDGVLLSNGPGDPARCTYAIQTIRELIGRLPIFGICLGHQLLTLALGGTTRKMRFGHRGANQPVFSGGKVAITSQNHGFEVSPESLPARITERNVSDGSVEGIADETKRVFSVQYHPEASPGPHDTSYLFQKFISVVSSQ